MYLIVSDQCYQSLKHYVAVREELLEKELKEKAAGPTKTI